MLKQKSRFVYNVCLLLLAGSLAACGSKGTNAPVDSSENVENQSDSTGSEATNITDEYPEIAESSVPDENVTAEKAQRSVRKKQQTSSAETIYYDGRLGDDDVTAQLVFRGNQVSGSIIFVESGKKHKVSGSLDSDGNIMLTEYAQSKKIGKLVGLKHRRKRRFSGDYLGISGESYTFKLSKTSTPGDGDDIYQ